MDCLYDMCTSSKVDVRFVPGVRSLCNTKSLPTPILHDCSVPNVTPRLTLKYVTPPESHSSLLLWFTWHDEKSRKYLEVRSVFADEGRLDCSKSALSLLCIVGRKATDRWILTSLKPSTSPVTALGVIRMYCLETDRRAAST